jgi:hypothetical protein
MRPGSGIDGRGVNPSIEEADYIRFGKGLMPTDRDRSSAKLVGELIGRNGVTNSRPVGRRADGATDPKVSQLHSS